MERNTSFPDEIVANSINLPHCKNSGETRLVFNWRKLNSCVALGV